MSITLIPFCLVAFFLSIVMLASRTTGSGLTGIWGFTIAGCLAVTAAIVVGAALPRLLSRDRDLAVTSRVSFGLLVLGWGPLMAFHLANVPGLDALRIHFAGGSSWAQRFPQLQVSLLSVLQFVALFVAAALAGIAFWRIRVHATRQGTELVRRGWRVLLTISAIYLSVALFLMFLGKVP